MGSVSSIVCSYDFTVCINNNKNVVSFGRSRSGAHGHKEDNVFSPKIIPTLNLIISISVCWDQNGGHCACLDNDGNVFTFGDNEYGKLGIGDKVKSFTSIPQKVNLPPCQQISCGTNHTTCLSENGEVYSFGYNATGQLGLGNFENSYNTPQLISSLKDVEFIECGYSYVFCKTFNNEIYCWGNNFYGQLGLGNINNQYTPVLCSSLLTENVIDIKCGNIHTLVLISNGDALSCGHNNHEQLGREIDDDYSSSFQKIEDLSEIIRIECGYYHSLCIDINNDLYVFGDNQYGQLGLGDTNNRNKPIKHPSLSNIIDISSRGNHTFVKTSNNEIFAFGFNDNSQLGIQIEKDRFQLTPIRVFEDNEDIWFSNINKSKAKSARF